MMSLPSPPRMMLPPVNDVAAPMTESIPLMSAGFVIRWSVPIVVASASSPRRTSSRFQPDTPSTRS